MWRRIAVVSISVMMLLSMIVIVMDVVPPARGITITVDDSGGADFLTIQEGIDAASPGDTVFVYNGTYYENVIVNKTISLIGEDRDTTFIDGGFSDNSVLITAPWVNLTGFTVAQGGMNPTEEAGLKVDSDNNTIYNNIITFNEGHAMLLNDSHGNYIHNNTISKNEQGLTIQYSSRNNFFNNTLSINDQCLRITDSEFNTFTSNNIIDSFYTVAMTSSDNNSFYGNTISGNQYGMDMNGCDDTTFSGNMFTDNNHRGLRANICANVTFTYNEFDSNGDHGLFMDGVVNFNVNNNTFNDTGVFITGGSKLGYWDTHSIDSTNTLNDKPVYYWKDRNGGVIPAGAGQVILVNCTGIDVRDQDLTYGVAGVELGFSNGNNITGNDLSDNEYGVYSEYSDHNNISGNEATSIGGYGIYLRYSSFNNITDNNFTWVGDHGIYIDYSANNSIINNVVSYSESGAISIIESDDVTIVNNKGLHGSQGIRIIDSSYSIVTGNNMSSMSNRGIALYTGGYWNVIENNTLSDNYYGISMESLSGGKFYNNTISNNTILENRGPGVWIYDSEGIIIEGNNISSGGGDGISLSRVENNRVINNTVVSNRDYGLKLQTSQNINVTGNEFTEDGIFISGAEVSHFNSHDIPVNNLVNGNPVRFIKNFSNLTIDAVPTGQVIIANCQDIGLRYLAINNTDCGIEIAFSTRINVWKNNVSDNDGYGIYVYESSYSSILKSDIYFNGGEGIFLRDSPNSEILWNNVSHNYRNNMIIDFSQDCNITGNNISNSDSEGVFIQASSNSVFSDNQVYDHKYGLNANALNNFQLIGNHFFNNYGGGMRIQSTTGTKIIDNHIYDNGEQGISLYSSTGANITGNSFTLNEGYGFFLSDSSGCDVTNNIFTQDGMFIYGDQLSDYNSHTILDNNMVNGEPLYYHKDIDGFAIDEIPVGQLILANCNDMDIRNIKITDTDVGIEAVYSTSLNISGNNISSNKMDGIYLEEVSGSNLTANTISHNERMGIFLYRSSNLNITSNIFEGDGIFIYGNEGPHFDSHAIPVNNLVNGRPIYYLVNANGLEFDSVPVGQLLLVNCTNINASNLLLDGASVGVEALGARYLNITSTRISNNYYGFYLMGWDNKISLNNISNNHYGVFLYSNYYTEISANNITFNEYGIYNDGYDTTVYHNNFIENEIQGENEWDEGWWDDGYPSGGNYWSDHSPICPDLYSGPDWPQESGSPDGICDDYYYIDSEVYDRYPLKYPWGVAISWDNVTPSSVLDLDILDWDVDSITLTWTAPGDDANSGTVTGYVVKFSTTGPITDDDWDTAPVYYQSWTPLIANSTEVHVISGLEPNTTYWFAIKAYDEMDNYGGISNSPGQKTNHTDMTPPGAISDLEASDPTNSTITLTWTAPADNGTDASSGSALFYDIRYNIDIPVIDGNWDSAMQVIGEPSPGAPGTTETCEVTGLLSGTSYYFAVKACDEAPGWSPISNSPNETTLGLDTSAPSISGITADPWTQEIGGTVTISADVTDNAGVYSVSVEIRDPFSAIIGNFTMVRIGGHYYNETVYTDYLGNYSFTIWAVDTSNNIAFKNGSFEIIEIPPVELDTTPPTISGANASPSFQELDEPVNFTATITDNVGMDGIWIQIVKPDGTELENISMIDTGYSDEFQYKKTFSELGEYTYKIWVKDSSDNWNFTEGSFVIQDTTSPVPDAGTSQEISQGETVIFDGSGSSDNDGIANSTWSFNYNGENIVLYESNPSFKFVTIGNYTVTLTVTDPSGNSASDSIWINVMGVDTDDDGLTDWDEENIYETNPNKPDTDGDGINDGDEIRGNTDPLIPNKNKEEDASFIENYWWIFIVIAVIIILLLLFTISKGKEKPAEEVPEEKETPPEGVHTREDTDEAAEEFDRKAPTETEDVEEPVPKIPSTPGETESSTETPAQPAKRKPPRPPRAPRSKA